MLTELLERLALVVCTLVASQLATCGLLAAPGCVAAGQRQDTTATQITAQAAPGSALTIDTASRPAHPP